MSTEIGRADVDAAPLPDQATATERSWLVGRLQGWLRITPADRETHAGSHHAARIALIISGVRCIISYVLVPFLLPVVGFTGMLAAPVSIVLCLVGIASAVLSIRRFWAADHPRKWMYTAFMAATLALLVTAIGFDLVRFVGGL